MDREELGFRAGDVIEVKDVSDKDWWWGSLGCRSGWFPTTFVRVNLRKPSFIYYFHNIIKELLLLMLFTLHFLNLCSFS